MEWEKREPGFRVPIKSWCREVEPGALRQAENLARHPKVFSHVALMPDCHEGFGMPIGGVIACEDAVIPNAVGVDIGCGMGAIETNLEADAQDRKTIRLFLDACKARIPLGEGNCHSRAQAWHGFQRYLEENSISLHAKTSWPGWMDERAWELALKNLGTLGGGNHFIEIQKAEDGSLWLMLHSGSRNLGYRIASYYHKLAQRLMERQAQELPTRDLAFLLVDSEEGHLYLRDMLFALSYAAENRRRMLEVLKEEAAKCFKGVEFGKEINIHHNYACEEKHFGRRVWVHRKGATSAQEGEEGIIPGSMGTPSYIVCGLGNAESFRSCSHGAGRRMGRKEACRSLSLAECQQMMGDVVFDGFRRLNKGKKEQALYDLEEAPLAYKNIEEVISQELDLIKPSLKLYPLGVLKG